MKARITFGIAILILACSFSSAAQMTAYANIYAEVIAPIGIGKSTDLTINQTIVGQKSVSGTAASFSVKGSSLNTFDITLPKEVFTITNGESSMTISDFTTSVVPANTLQNNVSLITINAVMNVSGTKTAGNYSSQNPFQVTLNYN